MHVDGDRRDINHTGTTGRKIESMYERNDRECGSARNRASSRILTAVSYSDRYQVKKASLPSNRLLVNDDESYSPLSESSMKIADIMASIPESALRFAVEQVVTSFPN